MIGIPLGLAAVNAIEWHMHKHILHDLGKKKGGRWYAHWEHHKDTRKNDFVDEKYTETITNERSMQEIVALSIGAAIVAPLFPIAPFFTGTLWYGAYNYWRAHRQAHIHPEWAREHIPWHYDHHMGLDQDLNWCVTRPWYDYVKGTRVAGPAGVMEKNVFGLDLPDWVNEPLNEFTTQLGWVAKPYVPKAERRAAKKAAAGTGAGNRSYEASASGSLNSIRS